MDEKRPLTASESLKTPRGILLPPTWKRIIAFLIDYFLLSLLFGFMISLSQMRLLENYFQARSIQDVNALWEFVFSLYAKNYLLYNGIEFIIWMAYFVLFWKGSGQTIGAAFMRIMVIPDKPPIKPKKNIFAISWQASFIRFFILYISIQLYGFPLLFVFHPLYNQRLHDFLSRTIVISVPDHIPEDEENAEEKENNDNARV